MRNAMMPSTPTVTCPVGDTEVPFVLPKNVSRIHYQARSADIRIAYRPGVVATGEGDYFTIKAAQPPYRHEDIGGMGPLQQRTLYVASSTPGAVLELHLWLG